MSLHKDDMFVMEAGFPVLLWQSQLLDIQLLSTTQGDFLESDEVVQSRSPHLLHKTGLEHVYHLLQYETLVFLLDAAFFLLAVVGSSVVIETFLVMCDFYFFMLVACQLHSAGKRHGSMEVAEFPK